MDINSKKAIITGASSGLGAAFSKSIIEKGGTVFGLARSTDKLEQLQDKLGTAFTPVTMDITNHEAIQEWVTNTFSDKHAPDILINNAGLGRFGDVDRLPLDEWEAMIQTNLSGIFYMTRQCIPKMKANDNVCHVINIASIAGKVANPQLTGYNASKFGVRGFSEALFQEVRYDGIKVTCFYPGSTATDFFGQNDLETHENMMQPQEVADVLINVLETPDNFLINDVTMRPLNPKSPNEQ
ncbi:NADP-dependent 3-hydroxy acid dehydrogenase YdfG [Fodinibius salinus]|uniref:NADP-dependent 3-hydroxy acid dehydrogenase YdfG n=1 Tax=Fodinibius salinus TaxID=860790 RepID=A0A5D3YJV3_9BACT|nr:SDR family NAD(P)-dependent oxidoreductase [Fodinibius salinus]TYP92716.1 NADP-dependent 3-hydroxy acid dehydrogenase YdfG [Fodinibius salinus]